MTEPAWVFVVDDDVAVRTGLRNLLVSAGHQAVTFADAAALAADPRIAGHGCILLDLRMPGRSGLEVQADLRARGIQLPVIFLTAFGTVCAGVQAMKAGAIDFLEKPTPPDVLLAAVERALALDREARVRRAYLEQLRQRWAVLTPREQEVVLLIVDGLANREIGERLGIAERTVKVHRGRVMEKMDADSLASVVKMVESLRSAGAIAETPPAG